MREGKICLIYSLVSFVLLSAGFSEGHISAGERSDIWNTLWSVDFVWQSILEGEFPYETQRLNIPNGGTVWISDYLGALSMGPFVYLLGWSWGYQVWLLMQMSLLGICMHGFARDLGAENRAWIAGLGCIFSGVFLSSIQNGASEAIGVFWVVLSIWMVWRARHGKTRWRWAVGMAFLGGLSSWYGAVMIGLFWLSLLLPFHKKTGLSLLIWCGGMIPFALLATDLSQGPKSLIQIKNPDLLMQLRRSIGPADPLSYIAPYPFQSPDFSVFWRTGDDYVHSCYIGWIVLLCVFWGWKKRREQGWIYRGVILCFLLSLGPVLIRNGQAVVFGKEYFGMFLGIPLPYFLLESLWGFSSLSLLYRLSFGVTLGCSLLASLAFPKSNRWVWGIVVMMSLELLLWSPVRDVPKRTVVPHSKGLSLLAENQPGVVLNHPVVRGMPYLFEQVLHRQVVTESINTPGNHLATHLWNLIEKNGCSKVRYTKPIYIVHHPQIEHRLQREDRLMKKAIEECPVLYQDEELIIVELK